MGSTTFIVYKKDKFGLESHVSEINSYSAKLRHARRRHALSAASKKLETTVKQRIISNAADVHAIKPRLDLSPVTSVQSEDAWAEPAWDDLWGGIVDPFRSTSVPVDHNFCRVIYSDIQSFLGYPSPAPVRGRDRMNDGLLTLAQRSNTRHHTVIHLLGGRSTPEAEQEETMSALSNPATGYAFLSCRATVMAEISNNPEMYRTALHYKQRAIEELRNKLEECEFQNSFYEKIRIIHSLFTAEIACGNLEAADVHGLALKYLLENDYSTTLVASNPTVLQGVLWQEIQRAVMSMTYVRFDLNRWTQMLGLRLSYNYWGSDPARTDLRLDTGDALVYEHLRPMMTEIMVLTHTPVSQFANKPRSTLLRISAQALVLQGRLVNRYVENTLLLSEASESLLNIQEALQIESYLCLAILYWLRRAMFTEKSVLGSKTGRRFYSASRIILDRLQALLTVSKPDHNLNSPRAKSRLFALYIGAIAEQAEMQEDECSDMASLPYHNKKFVLQAVLMGLSTWSDTQKVLQDFLYHEGIGTAAQFWFEKIQNLISCI